MTAVKSLGKKAEPTVAWFEFGRTLLLDAAQRLDVDGKGASETFDIDGARSALHASLSEPTAFSALVANLGASVPVAEVFALLAAVESDSALGGLVRRLTGDQQRGRVTLGLLRSMFAPDHPGVLAAAAGSPLRRSGFVDLVDGGSWADQSMALHPGVMWALVGDGSPDPELPAGTVIHMSATHPTQRGDAPGLVIVNGIDRIRRRQVGADTAAEQQYLCAAVGDDATQWAALVREATITGSGVVVEIELALPPVGRDWIERASHLSWVVSSPSGPNLAELPDRAWVHVEAERHDPTDEEWTAAFGPDAPRVHRLSPDQLDRVGRAFALSTAPRVDGAFPDLGAEIDDAVRRLGSGRLETLTTRIRPTRTWDDVVVSEDRLDVLHGIAERYRNSHQVYEEWGFAPNPSRGLVALFAGPSGTGKTLTAEIIAGDLGLDLFKLDLSSVVSKYIGETEKNLEQIFDAASAGNMVLFFDEADSLFGKRSEVKDARDRYANIEVSYLLQRLESYDGLVILATNLEKNVDEAFLRRIHARVQFALPGVDERRAIWERNLRDPAPLVDVDVDWLANRFELAGGVIRNASVQAAFLAAEDSETGGAIEMKHVVIGVAREFRKMGRLLKESDFGEYHHLLG